MASKLLTRYGTNIKSMTLIPSGGGVFEIVSDNKLIYSKKKTGEFPKSDNIISMLNKK